jgi:hypothetical protein
MIQPYLLEIEFGPLCYLILDNIFFTIDSCYFRPKTALLQIHDPALPLGNRIWSTLLSYVR